MAFERRFPVHVGRVTHELLVDYLTTDPDGRPTTRAPSTLDRQRATLRSFWKWATREGYVKVDPPVGLEHLYLGTGNRRPGRWLTRDEARLMLDGCEDDDQGRRDRTLLTVALLTGLRRTELATLPWRAVDLNGARLTVAGKTCGSVRARERRLELIQLRQICTVLGVKLSKLTAEFGG